MHCTGLMLYARALSEYSSVGMASRIRDLTVLMFVCCIGCSGNDHRVTPQQPDGRAATGSDCGRPLDRAAQISAMLSIEAHARAAAGLLPDDVSLSALNVESLQDARNVLLRDCSPAASIVRRRAAATTAAASGREERSEFHQEMDRTWRALVDDQELIQNVDALLTPDWTEHSTFAVREATIFNVLGKMSAPLNCDVEAKPFYWAALSKEGEVQLAVSFKVKKPLDLIVDRLDPQNWDRRNPFFLQTFYTNQVPDRRSSCTDGPVTAPPEDTSHAIGSIYKGPLFEDFSCPACPSRMQNVLSVRTAITGCSSVNPCGDPKTAPTQPAFQVCYGLDPGSKVPCGALPTGEPRCPRNALYGCAGQPPAHVDLLTDGGDVSVCAPSSSGYAEVVSRKTIKFDKRELNVATWELLQIAEAQATKNFIDMVCKP